eukprot:TRINITY_DN18363_c0_g1_i1.p1 TRINITY_DN18363_c0_g1~~TRINITY_DN18363_c0_g1_i1.p1  ORF type:complete len:117 (-),score=21.91 TRINITY_DN18363_c0_g1_i1:308-658(-)
MRTDLLKDRNLSYIYFSESSHSVAAAAASEVASLNGSATTQILVPYHEEHSFIDRNVNVTIFGIIFIFVFLVSAVYSSLIGSLARSKKIRVPLLSREPQVLTIEKYSFHSSEAILY